jgi:hypothetical protein
MKPRGFLFIIYINLLLLSLTILPAYAQSPILPLQQNINHYKLGTSLEILEDKEGNLVLQDFLKKDFSERFSEALKKN